MIREFCLVGWFTSLLISWLFDCSCNRYNFLWDFLFRFRNSTIKIGEKEFAIVKEMVEIKKSRKVKPGKLFQLLQALCFYLNRFSMLILVEEFTPGAIETSFGVAAIIDAVMEHSFRTREDGGRQTVRFCFTVFYYFSHDLWQLNFHAFSFFWLRYLALPTVVAPLKCSVLPLSGDASFQPLVKKLCELHPPWKYFLIWTCELDQMGTWLID